MTKRQRTILWLILAAYGILGIYYGLSTPPLESSDEYKHYPFVQYVQTERQLPVLDPDNPGRWLQEAAQPPLYYILMAGVTAVIDTTDLPEVHELNPQAFIGNPNQVGNKNLIIHDPAREAFPWEGSVLAIYLIRAISLLFGLGTIFITARLGTLVLDGHIGLFAAALTAFNPMFLFISAAVNNDSLAILLGSLSLYWLVRMWQDTPDPRRAWWRYFALGIVSGLALLTKLSAGGILGLIYIVLLWVSWRKRDWWILMGGGSLVLIPVLLLSGWWLARNWHLYGDLTGLNAFIAVQGTRENPLDWAGWLSEFGTFYRSYWGLFGGVNVAGPEWFYLLFNGLALFGMVGLGRWLWSMTAREHFLRSGAWLLLAWAVMLMILLIRWNLISPAFQGRLLFPALAAINVLWAQGLLIWFGKKWRTRTAVLFSAVLLYVAAFLPWSTIRPAYAWPEPLATVPESARISPVTFTAADGAIKLIGVEMEEGQNVAPGQQPVSVTLYWQAEETVSADYISSVHLLGREFESEGQVDRFPATGMIPTSRWQSGDIYRDEYRVTPLESAAAPSILRVAVSLFDDQRDQTLPATSADGLPVDPFIVGQPVRLQKQDSQSFAVDTVVDIPFEQGLSLAGFDVLSGQPGETIPLKLYWRASGATDKDYTVFVHLLNENGERISGADSPPVGGFYPTTWWQDGDVVDDVHWLPLPEAMAAGEYTILAGLYDPASGARLQRLDGLGDSLAIPLVVQPAE